LGTYPNKFFSFRNNFSHEYKLFKFSEPPSLIHIFKHRPSRLSTSAFLTCIRHFLFVPTEQRNAWLTLRYHLALVNVHVDLHVTFLVETLLAYRTMDRPISGMEIRVSFQDGRVGKGLWTVRTGVLAFTFVQFDVFLQTSQILQLHAALEALKDILSCRVDRVDCAIMGPNAFLELEIRTKQ
jgi:hypothetical protein